MSTDFDEILSGRRTHRAVETFKGFGMQKEIQVTGPKGYLIWLAQNQPARYAKVRERLKQQLPNLGAYMRGALGGLGIDAQVQLQEIGVDQSLIADPVIAAAPQGASSSWADTLSNIVAALGVGYATVKKANTQAKLDSIQLDRVRQGLPPVPIDPTSLGLSTATVGVGLTGNTQKLVMYGGLAILGVWVLTSVVGGRRRAA